MHTSFDMQIGIKDDFIGYSINCGNMSSAIGPFAVDRDILSVREAAQEMTVRIYNTNTKKIIHNVSLQRAKAKASLNDFCKG